jgi:sortase A
MNHAVRARGFAPRLSARRAAAVLLLVVGFLLVAEGVVTLVWQEPISAFKARNEQHKLDAQLSRIEAAALAAPVGHVGRGADSRGAAIASSYRRRAKDGKPLGRIDIPSVGARYVFVSGVSSGDLQKGPGHYPTTAMPGEHGTVGIAGHRTTYLAPFRHLDDLKRGDVISIRMPYGKFTYAVEGRISVSPKNTESMRRVAHDRLALTTCDPPGSAARRLVVTAALRSTKFR